ncbi:MAG: MoaD/ThiS family protein [Planctomycetota bacterium]
MVKIKIELFGPLTKIGNKFIEVEIPLNGVTVKELKRIISRKSLLLKRNIHSIAVVKNDEIVTDNEKITQKDTLSLLPPVSGG